MDQEDTHDLTRRIQIVGAIDRHQIEALQLEIRRLAKHYGIEIKELKVEKVPGKVRSRRKQTTRAR